MLIVEGEPVMNLQHPVRRILDRISSGYYLEKHILKDGKKHPVAIICPGGSYRGVSSFVEGLPYAKKLNAMGYSAIVVHYRCGEKHPFPVPMEDLARAIRDVLDNRERWNLDVEGYSLWGSSAGGHLTASLCTDSMGYKNYDLPKPGALILGYPVITMGAHAHPASRDYLLGKNQSPQLLELTSVETQITSDFIPTFLWVGVADRNVDTQNSYLLADALDRCGVPHVFLPIEGVGHGVGVGEGLPCEGWIEKAVAFWEQHRRSY